MHSYLVVAAKPGRAIPQHVLELLDEPAPADLAFVPNDHLRWTDDLGRLAFGGWQGYADAIQAGSHWHVHDEGLTSFSGRPWPHGGMWTSGQSWATQLDRHLRDVPVDRAGQPFDGVFTAASLARDGTGQIITDPLSVGMLYRAEGNDLVAFSTRPGLAARAVVRVGAEPERDPVGSAWMIYNGHVFGDRTGFARVRVLPLGSYVELHPRYGSRVRTVNPTPWIHPEGLPEDPAALVRLVHDDLLRQVESVARLPADQPPRADITGGRDSRLILALLMEAGLTDRFQFSAVGAEGSPDAVVARELAELCHLDFEPIMPTPMDPSRFLQRLQIHTFQTSGIGNAWDLQGGTGVQRRTSVSGLFGEPLKTQYSGYPPLETSEDLLALYLDRAHVDTLHLLRPEVREQYRRFIEEDLVERCDSESGLPFDRLDTFYIRNRVRRWGGTIEEIGHTGRVFPLYSLVALQAGFVLGPSRRRNEYMHFGVMREACPMLAEHRFAGRGWRDELLAEVPDGERFDSEPCTRSVGNGSAAPGPWQADRFDQHRGLIEDYLLGEPDSPLFEAVDRAGLERALDGDLKSGFHSRYQIFGALAAAVWLGHHEQAVPVGTPAADIPNPSPPPNRFASAARAGVASSADRGAEREHRAPAPRATSRSRARRAAGRLVGHAPPPIRRGLRRGYRFVSAFGGGQGGGSSKR